MENQQPERRCALCQTKLTRGTHQFCAGCWPPISPQDSSAEINARLTALCERMRDANRLLREQRGETPYGPQELN